MNREEDMKISSHIIQQDVSPHGGVYRGLPLITLSCAAHGYGMLIRDITGFSYGVVAAVGDRRGWQTMYRMERIVKRMSDRMKSDEHWLSETRKTALHICYQFDAAVRSRQAWALDDPDQFIKFIVHRYPWYMAGIGTYNLYWRYLDHCDSTMQPFPRRRLARLAEERNEIAKIYPRCERLLALAVKQRGYSLMATRSELSSSVKKHDSVLSRHVIQERQRGYVYQYAAGKEVLSAARTEIERVTDYLKKFGDHNATRVYGTSVQSGSVVGIVVTSLKKKRWPRHPIYIVSNTHPDEVSQLRRVKAIVTDEGGGILSHAAIVSRELQIPCVIRTKIATKIFKDGDRVEVDAMKGIVKKL